MKEGILGIKEVADYLKMRQQTVYRLVKQKRSPALKIGGQWKVKQQHLDKMFDKMLQDKLKEFQL